MSNRLRYRAFMYAECLAPASDHSPTLKSTYRGDLLGKSCPMMVCKGDGGTLGIYVDLQPPTHWCTTGRVCNPQVHILDLGGSSLPGHHKCTFCLTLRCKTSRVADKCTTLFAVCTLHPLDVGNPPPCSGFMAQKVGRVLSLKNKPPTSIARIR